MSQQKALTRPRTRTSDEWCKVKAARVHMGEAGLIELSLDVTKYDVKREHGVFIGIPNCKNVLHYCELPPFAFEGLLEKVGYVSMNGHPIFGQFSDFVGFEFKAKLRLKYRSANAFAEHGTAELIDAEAIQPIVPHTHRLVEQMADMHRGPLIFDSATRDEFTNAGYHIDERYHRGAGGRTAYDYREALFNGAKFNGKRLVKGNGRRGSIIIVAHRTKQHASRRVAAPASAPVTFLCMKQHGGLHVLIPIYTKQPFWRRDEIDADVGQIVAEIRRETQSDPLQS